MQLFRWTYVALLALFCAPALAAPPPPSTAPSPPTSAPATPPPLEAYGELPGVEMIALSPDGQGLATVVTVSGIRRLIVLDAKLEPRLDVPIEDAKVRDLRWVGNDTIIVFKTDTVALGMYFTQSKYELTSAMVVPLREGAAWAVFGKSNSIGHTVVGDFGTRNVGGRWLGYFGGIDTYKIVNGPVPIALYEVDLSKNTNRQITQPSDSVHARRWLVDATGKPAATLDIMRAAGRWRILNAAGTVLVEGIDRTLDVGMVGLGKDGATVIYSVENDATGVTDRREVSLAGGTPTAFLPGVEFDRLYFDPETGYLIGYKPRKAPPVFFDPARQSAVSKTFRAFPRLNVELVNWSTDFSRLLVRTRGNRDSGTYYIVDVTQRRAYPVGYERLEIPPDSVGPISTLTYKAADGLEISGILTLPPGKTARNLPVVVLPHGGPEAEDSADFDWWAQAFASRGYAVFQPNYRGSTDRDDAFRRAGYGQWGRKMQTDISDGLADLARQGVIDPARACIVGASYGGYAALAGVTLQHGLYRCAASVSGISDIGDLYSYRDMAAAYSAEGRRSLRESLGKPSTFDEVSPRKHAALADAPILLIHGKDDTVVQYSQSERMASALRSAGKPVEFVTLREEDHWLSRAATRKQMLEAAVTFVGRHNPAD